MARRSDTTHLDIQNLSHEQKSAIDAMAEKTGESRNALAKRLFAEEAERLEIEWPKDDTRTWKPQ